MCPFLRLGLVVFPIWSTLFGVPGFAADVPMEKRLLLGGDTAKSWSMAESTMEASSERVKTGKSSLHWHVTVDYNAGEAKYPIGWPRVSHGFLDADRDWSDWEYLTMWIYTETSREALPRDPVGLGLHTPDKASAFHRPLSEIKKGEWVEISIPLAQLPESNDVRQIQFHIAESNYRHGDTLDLWIDGLSLTRHSVPVVGDFAAECAVMFSDARSLPVRFQILGLKRDALGEVTCELRREGKTAARGVWKVPRGPQRCVFDLGKEQLAPGDYELVAQIAGGAQSATAKMRVVESPWGISQKETGK